MIQFFSLIIFFFFLPTEHPIPYAISAQLIKIAKESFKIICFVIITIYIHNITVLKHPDKKINFNFNILLGAKIPESYPNVGAGSRVYIEPFQRRPLAGAFKRV